MRVLIVYAHPRDESLCAAALERVRSGLGRGGHEFELLDLYAIGFDPVLSQDQHSCPPGSGAGVARELELLEAADALVFVYPTWWGGQPAMLKGWLDRVLDAGGAYGAKGPAGRRPDLRRVRKLIVVTTHGSSKWVNGLQGEPGKRVLLRGVRSLLKRSARSRWIAAYAVDRSTADDRLKFLDRVERELAKL
jgi:NAD(P)H dehydrogenase (quinone)